MPRCSDCDGKSSGGTTIATCETTEKCKALHPGEAWACLQPGKQDCVRLDTDACQVSDGWDRILPNSQPLFVGAILALDRKGSDGVLAPSTYDIDQGKAFELARSEWQVATQGIPVGPNKERQPLVTVTCNSKGDPSRVTAAMTHLEKLGAATVLFTSHDDVTAALPKLGPRNILALCTDCDAAAFKPTDTVGLLYHLAPDFGASAKGLVNLWVQATEARVRAGSGPINGVNLRVLYLSNADVASQVREAQVVSALSFNGKPASQQASDFMYLQAAAPGGVVDFAAVAAQVASFQPDIVVLDEGATSVVEYVPRIESAWPAGPLARPQYMLFSYNTFSKEVEATVGANEELRKRITGFTPRPSEATIPIHKAFVERYRARYDADPVADSAYEGFYLLGSALVSATHDQNTVFGKLSGLDVARCLGTMLDQNSRREVETSPAFIMQSVGFLSARPVQSIRLLGTYSEFAYAVPNVTGAQPTDVRLYCPALNDKGVFGLQTAAIYRHATQDLEAPIDLAVCAW